MADCLKHEIGLTAASCTCAEKNPMKEEKLNIVALLPSHLEEPDERFLDMVRHAAHKRVVKIGGRISDPEIEWEVFEQEVKNITGRAIASDGNRYCRCTFTVSIPAEIELTRGPDE